MKELAPFPEQFSMVRSVYFLKRNLVRNVSNFLCPQVNHMLVIIRIVAHVTRDILFL